MPKINLTPKHANLIEPTNWSKSRLTTFSSKWLKTLKEIWVKRYCRNSNNANENIILAADNVIRCMKAEDPNTKEFINC